MPRSNNKSMGKKDKMKRHPDIQTWFKTELKRNTSSAVLMDCHCNVTLQCT